MGEGTPSERPALLDVADDVAALARLEMELSWLLNTDKTELAEVPDAVERVESSLAAEDEAEASADVSELATEDVADPMEPATEVKLSLAVMTDESSEEMELRVVAGMLDVSVV